MSRYLRIDIDSGLTKEAVKDICLECLPSFTWKFGNSEYEGYYVSGRKQDVGQIQCWTGEQPMAFALSLLEEVSVPERLHLFKVARNDIGPRIGTVLSVVEN